MNLTKKKFLVFTSGMCLVLMVLFLSLSAGDREGQDAAVAVASQNNGSDEGLLPADLKQLVAFKTKNGGDLKIYLLCDDSVLVSFLEKATPELVEELSRIDTSDLPALYQTLTGCGDVPGDVVRMHDIITANMERQKLPPRADRQEYPIIYPFRDESVQGGIVPAGTGPGGVGYSDNRITAAAFKTIYGQLDPDYNMTVYTNYREPFYQEYVRWSARDLSDKDTKSCIYVNWVRKLTDSVYQYIDRYSIDGKWVAMKSQKISLGKLSGMVYFSCRDSLRLRVENPYSASFHTSFRVGWPDIECN